MRNACVLEADRRAVALLPPKPTGTPAKMPVGNRSSSNHGKVKLVVTVAPAVIVIGPAVLVTPFELAASEYFPATAESAAKLGVAGAAT